MVKILSLFVIIFPSLVHAMSLSEKEKIYNDKIAQGLERINPKLLDKLKKNQTGFENANMDSLFPKYPEPIKLKQPSNIHFKILISNAMGQDKLKRLMKALSYRDDVSFVIRGMLNTEKTIGDVSKRIINLIKDFKQVPNVELDPRPFKEINAALAPSILAYQGEELMASATGIANPVWMTEQIKEGKVGDLGNFGDVVAISERDIGAILKERMEALDGKKLIEQAKKSYWEKAKFLLLPEAKEQHIRRFTPEIAVNETLYDSNGEIIVAKGTRINTLNRLSFNQRIVVFDATNQNHIEFVKNLPEIKGLTTKLITTRFNRNKQWNAIKDVEKKLDNPVYLLNKDILDAFELKVVPSIVVADNKTKEFIVSEYKL